jgi:hypothetical protein
MEAIIFQLQVSRMDCMNNIGTTGSWINRIASLHFKKNWLSHVTIWSILTEGARLLAADYISI